MFRLSYRLAVAVLLAGGLLTLPSSAWGQPRPGMPATPRPAPAQPARPAPAAMRPAVPTGMQISTLNPLGMQNMARPGAAAPMTQPMPGPYAPPAGAYASGMGGYGMGGYGMGGYGMGGYGNGMAGSQNYSQGYGGDNGEAAAARYEAMSLSRILTASGVPNDGGQLRWPVGLRVVGGPAAEELRQQIDALFQLGAAQAQVGAANPHLAWELARSVDALRTLLLRDRDQRFSLALTTYEESEHFLTKLDHARKLLRAGLEPSGGQVQLTARAEHTAEVGLYDNRFQPATLTVAAGTTVRWTNHGQHHHTVTSDKGDWGSKELAPGATYSYTFAHPGEFEYHCEVHPAEMRGTVLVK